AGSTTPAAPLMRLRGILSMSHPPLLVEEGNASPQHVSRSATDPIQGLESPSPNQRRDFGGASCALYQFKDCIAYELGIFATRYEIQMLDTRHDSVDGVSRETDHFFVHYLKILDPLHLRFGSTQHQHR